MSELTCIVCPMGCRISVNVTDSNIEISGNNCRRGEVYARNETIKPQRTLTGVVAVVGSNRPLPVKTATPIPKDKIFEVMLELKKVHITPPVKIGQVLKEDIAGTGINIVATKNQI